MSATIRTATTNVTVSPYAHATAHQAARVGLFGLAALVTTLVLASLGQIADRQVNETQLALATPLSGPTQVVVITGKRLPQV
jgi:hypothetical protein